MGTGHHRVCGVVSPNGDRLVAMAMAMAMLSDASKSKKKVVA